MRIISTRYAFIIALLTGFAVFSAGAQAEVRSLTVGETSFDIDFDSADDVYAELAQLAAANPELAEEIAAAAALTFADVPGFDPALLAAALAAGAPEYAARIAAAVAAAYPDSAAGIAAAVARQVPDEADAVADAVSALFPEQQDAINDAIAAAGFDRLWGFAELGISASIISNTPSTDPDQPPAPTPPSVSPPSPDAPDTPAPADPVSPS